MALADLARLVELQGEMIGVQKRWIAAVRERDTVAMTDAQAIYLLLSQQIKAILRS